MNSRRVWATVAVVAAVVLAGAGLVSAQVPGVPQVKEPLYQVDGTVHDIAETAVTTGTELAGAQVETASPDAARIVRHGPATAVAANTPPTAEMTDPKNAEYAAEELPSGDTRTVTNETDVATQQATDFQERSYPSPSGHARPIVFVHGLELSAANNCNNTWRDMQDRFRNEYGFTGTFHSVQYYFDDTQCSIGQNMDIGNHGAHSNYHAEDERAHRNGGHTLQASIRHLAFHFAWALCNQLTCAVAGNGSGGQTVDIVAHSMGGLLVRYAMMAVERDDPWFPSELRIKNVVTLGTPHEGTRWAGGCYPARQCRQMAPGSGFIEVLREYGQHPDPNNSAPSDWTLVASEDDAVVPAHPSGLGMAADHKVDYLESNDLGHSGYMHHIGPPDANVKWRDGGSWHRWYSAPRAVPWARWALSAGSW